MVTVDRRWWVEKREEQEGEGKRKEERVMRGVVIDSCSDNQS